MPMLDATIPEGAFTPEAEARFLREATDLLMRHEGMDPANPVARAVSVVFVHRPATVYVGGEPARKPFYRFVSAVMEGLYDDARRSGIAEELTRAVATAEGSALEDVAPRVWIFPLEVPDGLWAGQGTIRRLPDFLGSALGPSGAKEAVAILRARRAEAAKRILSAMPHAAPEDRAK